MASPTVTTESAVEKAQFDDRAQLLDLLNSQKHITGVYNTFLNECETPALISCFSGILNDEHELQNEIFTDMQKRGWYEPKAAETVKVDKAVRKFFADASK